MTNFSTEPFGDKRDITISPEPQESLGPKNSEYSLIVRKAMRRIATATVILILPLILSASDDLIPPSHSFGQIPPSTTEQEQSPAITEQEEDISSKPIMSIFSDYMDKGSEELPIHLQELSDILNDSSATRDEFVSAIDNWDPDTPIFPHITSRWSQIRFIRYVIELDKLNEQPYLTKSPIDIDGDGSATITSLNGVVRDEAGNIWEEEPSYVCYDFSRDFALLHGLSNHMRTEFPESLRLPLFHIDISDGLSGHTINAVYIGPRQELDDEIGRLSNWYFFEPQTDEHISSLNVMDYYPGGSIIRIFGAVPDRYYGSQETVIVFFKTSEEPDTTFPTRIRAGGIEIDYPTLRDTEMEIVDDVLLSINMRRLISNTVTDEQVMDEGDFREYDKKTFEHVLTLLSESPSVTEDEIYITLQKANSLPRGFQTEDFMRRIRR